MGYCWCIFVVNNNNDLSREASKNSIKRNVSHKSAKAKNEFLEAPIKYDHICIKKSQVRQSDMGR
jgi:hypothetical protein